MAERGLCLWEITSGDPPIWDSDGPSNRDLAARLCASCPVRRECLEFELRLGGAQTVGVWGGLAEDDRRALHAHVTGPHRPRPVLRPERRQDRRRGRGGIVDALTG